MTNGANYDNASERLIGIVFIDARVSDLQTLIGGAQPGEKVVVLDPSTDGLRQIADFLTSNQIDDLSSISIVAHGSVGSLLLGSTLIDESELAGHASMLRQIGKALALDGDLQLYGCDIASGATGQQFIADLSSFAGGINVAAATHDIGLTPFGENWTLDATTNASAGSAIAPFTEQALSTFQDMLGGGDPTGQLWMGGTGLPINPHDGQADSRVVHIDSDGSANSLIVANYNNVEQGLVQSVALDTAGDLYFWLDGNHDKLHVSKISTGAELANLVVGSVADSDTLNNIIVDPRIHTIYMSLEGGDYLDLNTDGVTQHRGEIIKITYDPTTGKLTSPYDPFATNPTSKLPGVITDENAVLANSRYNPNTDTLVGPSSVRDMFLSKDGSTIYYVDDNDGDHGGFWGVAINGVYKISTSGSVGGGNQPTPTMLSSQSQFPADDSKGYITSLAVNETQGLIYFTTDDSSGQPDGAHPAENAVWWMPITGGTATAMTLPPGVVLNFPAFFGSNIVFDPTGRQLYVSDRNTTTVDGHVIQLSLSGDGKSFMTGAGTFNNSFFVLDAGPSNNAYVESMVWDTLPNLTGVSGTSAVITQGSGTNTTLLTATPTISDPDGDNFNLAGATIRVIGGVKGDGTTFGVTSGNLTGATGIVGDLLSVAGTQSGTVDSGKITVSWNASTQTLTLSGNQPTSDYATILSQIAFQESAGADNSVGSHPTRVIDFIVSDGVTVANPSTSDPNEKTITITLNRAPTVGADTYSVLESGSAAGTSGTGGTGVLHNDSDPDGDAVTVTQVNGSAGDVGKSTAGSYGHLTLNGNGSFSYTADMTSAIDGASTGSHPTDSFTYTVSDGTGGTTNSTVDFSIDRPPAADADGYELTEGASATGTAGIKGTGVLGNDSDPDGDTITVSAVNGSAGNVGKSTAGTYGHLTLKADGSFTYNADQTSAIDSAAAGSHPLDSFTYSISDGLGGTAGETVTFTIDRPPVVDLNGGGGGHDVTASFTEQGALLFATSATITNADTANLVSLTATLSSRPDGNAVESLSLDAAAAALATTDGLTVTYTASTGVLSITGTASNADYQSILDGIVYYDSSDNPNTTNRTVDVVTTNGTNASATSTATIDITRVNDAPTVALQGHVDVVTGTISSNDVGVLLGDGLGSFTAGTTSIGGGKSPVSIALGDVDGDGKLDIVTANNNTNDVSVLLGDGLGAFMAGTTSIGGGTLPISVALGDVDDDGNLDIVTANNGSADVSVLLGDGLGGVKASTQSVGATFPVAVALGDVNGDGKLDVITANISNVSLLLGDGLGGFIASTTGIGGGDTPNFIATGDFDGDGKLDIVTANFISNNVSILLNDGVGGFTASTTGIGGGIQPISMAVGDLNGDGKLDIVTANFSSNNVSVLLGDGLGGFAASALGIAGGLNPYSVAVGDVTGDGKLDIVTANQGSNNISVLVGDGLGGFAANTVSGAFGPSAVALGDLDNLQVTDEDTSLVFSSAHGNAITVGDVDAGGSTETVTLGVGHGTVTLASGSGVTVSGGADGSASVSFTGTIAQLNAALAGLTYDPAHNYNGDDTLTVTIDDGGATGGGALSATTVVPISVTAVNDAPVFAKLDASVSTTEQNTVNLDSDVTISDAELDALNDYAGASLTITPDADAVSTNFTFGSGGAFTDDNVNHLLKAGGLAFASYGVASGVLTVNFTSAATAATSALVNDVLEHIVYAPTGDDPSPTVHLAYSFSDGNTGSQGTGGEGVGTGSQTVTITLVNDAPEATIGPEQYDGQPGVGLDLKNKGLEVHDVDGETGSETVTLSVTEGTLHVDAGGSGAGVSGDNSASVTITGTIDQINDLLNTDATSVVSFVDSSPTGLITLKLAINDNGHTGGGDQTAEDTATISLDQPPTLANDGNTAYYTEQQTAPAAILVDSAITVADADAPADPAAQINSATVKMTVGQLSGDTLAADTAGTDITAVFDGTDTLTLSGPDTIAHYQQVLQSVTFLSTSDDPTDGGADTSRTVTWTVKDIFDVPSLPATTTIDITSVNDAPVLDASKSPVLGAVDEDADSPGLGSGTLVSGLVDFAGGNGNVGDPDGASAVTGIALTGTDTTDGTWFYSTDGGANWLVVGTVSDGSALLLAADADTRLYFEPSTADFNGTVTGAITFRAWDRTSGANGDSGVDTTSNGGTTAFSTATDTADIAVTAVADIAGDSVSGDEDTAISAFVLANDSFENTPTITAFSQGTNGSVIIDNNQTPLDSTDDFLSYTPDKDYNGSDSFTYTVTSGGVTETATVKVTIDAVADIAGDTAAAGEDGDPVDIAVQANDTFESGEQAITGVTQGAHGSVVVDDHGTADTTDDTLTFTPNDPDYNGSDSFDYTVTSAGVTETATVSVTIDAVADIADDSVAVDEDSGSNTLDLLKNDSFENAGRAITAVGVAGHGTVAIDDNGTAGDATDDFVTYATNDPDYNGSDSFSYTVTSNGLTETATVSVTIDPVADIADDSVTVGEDSGSNTLDLLKNDGFESAGRFISAVGAASHGTVAIDDNGTAGDATDDFATYTPDADYNGSDSFDYTVTSGGVTETATVSVTIDAVADIADDNVSVDEDSGSNKLDLLKNDSFEDTGRAITAVTQGAHGTVAIDDNGTAGDLTDDFVTYTTSDPDYNGADSFDYTVTSGGVTETATVTVTIDAVADIAGDSVSVDEDSGSNKLDLLKNDSFESAGRAITAVGAAGHGTVAIDDNGTVGDATDDFVTYTTGDPDYNGSDSFSYTVTSNGTTETATVSVTIDAVADIAGDSVSVDEDSGSNTLDLLKNDSFENAGRAITAVGTAGHGTVAIDDNGTVGDATDDFVTYTTGDPDYNGSDSFSYTVTSNGLTETATVQVTIKAVADIAADSTGISEDTAVDVAVLGNDTFEGTPAITGTTDGSHGKVTVDDHGTLDTTDDTLVYTPDADFNGSDSFDYTVTSGGVTETATVSVTVSAVTDIAGDSVTVDEDSGANKLDLLKNDSFESAGRAITAVGTASHGAVAIDDNGTVGDATDDYVTYTPDADTNGSDSFSYTVTSNGSTETATVSVTVGAVADIADDNVSVDEDSGSNALDLLKNDSFESAGRAITAVGTAGHGTVTIDDNGTAGDATDDFVTYTADDPDFNGSDSFSYTVTSGGVTETATVHVTIDAVADIADDSVSLTQDSGSNSLDLLKNDSFENAGRFISAVGPASHGTVAIDDNGTAADKTDDFVTFTTNDPDYNGPDSFSYTVTSNGATETATVSVTIDPLIVLADDTATTGEDTPVDIAVLDNDTLGAKATISATTDGAHGAVGIDDHGTADTADDTVVYTPDGDFHGADSFSYSVTLGSVTKTAKVDVTVDAVTDIAGDNVSVNEDSGSNRLDLLANDTFANPGRAITAVTQGVHGTVAIDDNGTAGDASDDFVTYTTHDPDYHGTDSFGYTVTSNGSTETATVQVTIKAVADIVADKVTVNEDSGSTRLNLLANDTFENAGRAITAVTQGTHGTVSVDDNSTPADLTDDFVTYKVAADTNGPDSFSYTVTSNGSTETATVTVTVGSTVDIAADSVTVDEDSAANKLDLLKNDSFENPDRAITAVGQGSHGTVAIDDNGTAGDLTDDFVTYTPTGPDYAGADAFTYRVTSGGVDEIATVNVTIKAVADIVADSVTVAEDSGVNTLELLANDTFENAGRGVFAAGTASHGTVAIDDHGTPGDIADDFVTYTPDADYHGADSFSYTVLSNGTLETATVTVTVTAAADAVTDSATTREDTAVGIAVLGNDSFDGKPVITGVTDGAHGTVTIDDHGTPGGADDTLVYTPDANFNGADSFSYTVTSGGATETGAVKVTVTPVSDAPAGADNIVTIAPSQTYAFTLADFGFSDPADDPADSLLSIAIDGFSGAGVISYKDQPLMNHQVVSVADILAGSLQFTAATPAGLGYHSTITFQLRDDGGTADGGADLQQAPSTLTIAVEPPQPPVAHADWYATTKGTPLAVSASFGLLANDSDANGDVLAAELAAGPAHGALTLNADGSFGYTPDAGFTGHDSFSYRTTDGAFETAPATVNLTVGTLTTPAELIGELYLGYYDRAPDASGFDFWLNAYETPGTAFFHDLGRIAASFADPDQAETVALYPFLHDPAAADFNAVEGFVIDAYANLFGRTVDGADQGVRYWSVAISKALHITAPAFGDPVVDNVGPLSPATTLLALIDGALGSDATTILNKTVVGLYFNSEFTASGAPFSSNLAHHILDTVNADPSSVLAAETVIHSFAHSGGLGGAAADTPIVGLTDPTQEHLLAA